MIHRAVICCLLLMVSCFPVMAAGLDAAATEVTQASQFSFFYSFIQMISALLVVIGLILLVYYLASRLMRKIPALTPSNQYIRVLEVRTIGPRKALLLVEVSGEYLLLASSGDNLNLVSRISMLEELELIKDDEDRLPFVTQLKRKLSRSREEENVTASS